MAFQRFDRDARLDVQPEWAVDLARDPLLSCTALPYRIELHPLGFPALVESNSPRIAASLEESWGCFRPQFEVPAVHLSVIVTPVEEQSPLPPPVFRSRRHLLSITADEANFAGCDLKSGYGCAWITSQTVTDPVYLRDSFTEAPLLAMLNTRYLAPIHAACLVRDGAGILLCGASGSGKSSLAFAAAMSGWDLLCDDACFLVRQSVGLTIVGNPFLMRFKPDAVNLFPRLRERQPVTRTNGKPTIHLHTAECREIVPVQRAEANCLMFLHRDKHGRAQAVPRQNENLALLRLTDYGDEQDIAEQRAVFDRLARLTAFDLHYSGLDDAIECLNGLMSQRGA